MAQGRETTEKNRQFVWRKRPKTNDSRRSTPVFGTKNPFWGLSWSLSRRLDHGSSHIARAASRHHEQRTCGVNLGSRSSRTMRSTRQSCQRCLNAPSLSRPEPQNAEGVEGRNAAQNPNTFQVRVVRVGYWTSTALDTPSTRCVMCGRMKRLFQSHTAERATGARFTRPCMTHVIDAPSRGFFFTKQHSTLTPTRTSTPLAW